MALRVQEATGSLGAAITGVTMHDLSDADLARILEVLARRGVVCLPDQTPSPAELKAFCARLGDLEINVVNAYQEPGHPEVMLLSNIIENGKPIGLPDAGQDWHADMSYSRQVAFANVLHACRVPMRDGRPLGATQFCDVAAAWDDLPAALQQQLRSSTVTHDFAKFWEAMRSRSGSTRPPLTAAQRAAKPPVSHPAVIRNPLSGREVLYVNPGYAVRVDAMPAAESDRLLDWLFNHQTQDKYLYIYHWTANDVLIWDNLRVIHRAVADYGAHEHRLMKRCQVMATRYQPLPV